ncbi:MAG: class I SAM-dependent methyltransferase [Sphingomonadaceae bacterium]
MNFSAEGFRIRARTARRSGGGPLWLFLKGFLKHPSSVASVVPSSKRLIERMLDPVDWSDAGLVVEYGPGVGVFTRAILERLPAEATLIAIDTNADFVDYLNATIGDNRLLAVTGSAARVRQIVADCGFKRADHVLSGLPFSTLPEGVGPRIARETHAVLRPGGAFLVYQFSPMVLRFIAPHFARIDRAFEWRNIPPANLFWAWKR